MINESIILLSHTQPQGTTTVRSSHTELAVLNANESFKQPLEAVGANSGSKANDTKKSSNRGSCESRVSLCHNPVLKSSAVKRRKHLKNTMK